MEHFLTLLETRLRRNWNKPALSDYRGDTFTSAQVAAVSYTHLTLPTMAVV